MIKAQVSGGRNNFFYIINQPGYTAFLAFSWIAFVSLMVSTVGALLKYRSMEPDQENNAGAFGEFGAEAMEMMDNPMHAAAAAAAARAAAVIEAEAAKAAAEEAERVAATMRAWDKRRVSREKWLPLIEGKASGTFVVRDSSSTAVNVVGTITVVKPGRGTTGGSEFFHQQIIRGGGGVGKDEFFQLVGSKHTHTTLDALVEFYQKQAYFAEEGKRDVPAKLITPSYGQVEYVAPFWREEGQGDYGTLFDADGVAVGTATLYGSPEMQLFADRVAPKDAIYDVCSTYSSENELRIIPVPTFEEAMKTAARHCGADKGRVAPGGACFRQAARYGERHPHNGKCLRDGFAPLTADDIAAIHMYTMETALFKTLNRELGCYGQTQTEIPDFLPFTKLLMSALAKLPRCSLTLYRGMNGVSADDAVEPLQQDGTVTNYIMWNQFVSCTDSLDTVRDFLGKTGKKIVFRIDASDVANIAEYSAVPVEKEYLLPPMTKAAVVSIKRWAETTEFQIRQVQHGQKTSAC